MKKNVLVLLFTLFGFNNITYSASCGANGDIFPNESYCYVKPDFYQVKFHEMGLCTSAPTPPTTSSAIIATSCNLVINSATGVDVEITDGSSTGINSAITRPDNGIYTHGYIKLGIKPVLKDTRTWTQTLDSNHDGTLDGAVCVTTSSSTGVTCDTSAGTPVDFKKPYSFGGSRWHFPTSDPYVWLVDSSNYLEDTQDSDASYLVAALAFSSPVVVTDSSTVMDASFKVTEGLRVGHHNDGSTRKVSYLAGPFSVNLTVQ